MSEATVGHVDDVRLDGFELFVSKAPSFEYTLGEVFAHDIGYTNELSENFLRFFVSKIKRNTELVGVVIIECATKVDASSIVDKRWGATENIPTAFAHGVFDADDLGAE